MRLGAQTRFTYSLTRSTDPRPRNLHLGPAGAQRVLAPEPVLHRRGAESEAEAGAGISAAGCELLFVDGGALSEGEGGWFLAIVVVVDLPILLLRLEER